MRFIYLLLLCPFFSYGQGANHIQGVWKQLASSWNADTKQYADCEIYKFITEDRWASVFYRPETGEVAGYGGGTYVLHGRDYLETIEYFSWDPSAVGLTQKFKMDVHNRRLTQDGDIDTDKYNYKLHIVYEKVDNLYPPRQIQNSPAGTWQLIKATWGEATYDANGLQQRYGQVIKIITPGYFTAAYFDKDKKTVGGAVFGTCYVADGKYHETIKSWTWDPTSIGTQPTFNFSIDQEGNLRQYGKLEESEDYKNYVIDEYYVRL